MYITLHSDDSSISHGLMHYKRFNCSSMQPFVHHYLEQTSVQILKQKQQKVVDASVQTKVIIRPLYLKILRKVWCILESLEYVGE